MFIIVSVLTAVGVAASAIGSWVAIQGAKKRKENIKLLSEELNNHTLYYNIEEKIVNSKQELEETKENTKSILKNLEDEAERRIRSKLSYLLDAVEEADEELDGLQKEIENARKIAIEVDELRDEKQRLIELFENSNIICFEIAHDIICYLTVVQSDGCKLQGYITSTELPWLINNDFVESIDKYNYNYCRYERYYRLSDRPVKDFYAAYGKYLEENT